VVDPRVSRGQISWIRVLPKQRNNELRIHPKSVGQDEGTKVKRNLQKRNGISNEDRIMKLQTLYSRVD